MNNVRFLLATLLVFTIFAYVNDFKPKNDKQIKRVSRDKQKNPTTNLIYVSPLKISMDKTPIPKIKKVSIEECYRQLGPKLEEYRKRSRNLF